MFSPFLLDYLPRDFSSERERRSGKGRIILNSTRLSLLNKKRRRGGIHRERINPSREEFSFFGGARTYVWNIRKKGDPFLVGVRGKRRRRRSKTRSKSLGKRGIWAGRPMGRRLLLSRVLSIREIIHSRDDRNAVHSLRRRKFRGKRGREMMGVMIRYLWNVLEMGRIENYIRAKWSEAYDFVEKMKRIVWDRAMR